MVHITQQEEARETCKEQEEVKEGETSTAAETSVSSEKKKIPPLTISLQPGKASLLLAGLGLFGLCEVELDCFALQLWLWRRLNQDYR